MTSGVPDIIALQTRLAGGVPVPFSGGSPVTLATPPHNARQPRRARHSTHSRIVLRPPLERDRAAYLAALAASRPHLDPWFPLNRPGESDDAYVSRQIAQARASDDQQADWRRAAFAPNGALVGVVNINRITRDANLWHATINWWVSTPHAGRGIATEIVARAIDYAFMDIPGGLQLDVVHAAIDDANAPSTRLAHKLGFVSDPVPAYTCSINGVDHLQTIWTIRRPADIEVARTTLRTPTV